MTKISWTHNPATGGRGATWNPVTGCTKVSTGCHNCYAIPRSHRLAGMATTRDKYRGLTKAGGSNWTGVVRCHEDVLQEPLKVRQPTTFFVNSMSDMFHEDVPFEFIYKMFAVMGLCTQHIFLLLTKRPHRAKECLTAKGVGYRISRAVTKIPLPPNLATVGAGTGRAEFRKTSGLCGVTDSGGDTSRACWPFPNVRLGVSVEDQAACVRIADLLRCPAAVRFLSVEPMLERIRFFGQHDKGLEWEMFGLAWSESNCRYERIRDPGIHQIIIGGESGPKARPFNLEWAYDLIDPCRSAGVAIFMKQIGSNAWLDGKPYPRQHPDDRGKRDKMKFWPKGLQIQEYPQR